MKRLGVAASIALVLLAAACGGSSGSSSAQSPNGVVNLVLWMGYTPPPPASQGAEYESLKALVADFTKLHPKIHIRMEYVNNDNALEKLTVALQGNKPPDITYQYGTNLPQLAPGAEVVDLTKIASSRRRLQLERLPRRRARRLHRQRQGARRPGPGRQPRGGLQQGPVRARTAWRRRARTGRGTSWSPTPRPSDRPGKNISASTCPPTAARPRSGSTSAMLWEAGGDLMAPDSPKTAFNSPQGAHGADRAAATWQQAKALYLNSTPDSPEANELFNASKIGMFITGPWNLSDFPDAQLRRAGDAVVPAGGNHDTIAGPDAWVVMDNGRRARRGVAGAHAVPDGARATC